MKIHPYMRPCTLPVQAYGLFQRGAEVGVVKAAPAPLYLGPEKGTQQASWKEIAQSIFLEVGLHSPWALLESSDDLFGFSIDCVWGGISGTSSQKSIYRSNFLNLRNFGTKRDTTKKLGSNLWISWRSGDFIFSCCRTSLRFKVTEV